MTDEHQTNAIIATALLDSFRDHPEQSLDPEEAKLIAKRIVAALEDAGTPDNNSRSLLSLRRLYPPDGYPHSARPAPLKRMMQCDCNTIHARIVILTFRLTFIDFFSGAGFANRSSACVEFYYLLPPSLNFSSSPSASRPSVNVSECNITMPCDFANSQLRRARIASQRRNQQSLAPRAIPHRTELAEVNGGRGKFEAAVRPVARGLSVVAAHLYAYSAVSSLD